MDITMLENLVTDIKKAENRSYTDFCFLDIIKTNDLMCYGKSCTLCLNYWRQYYNEFYE